MKKPYFIDFQKNTITVSRSFFDEAARDIDKDNWIMIKVNGYGYDAMNNALTASAAFLKKASQLNTPEYMIVKQLRADNPGMKIVKAEKRSCENRPVNIAFKKMEEFIGLCVDCEVRKKEFAKLKALSKIQSLSVLHVRYTERVRTGKDMWVEQARGV